MNKAPSGTARLCSLRLRRNPDKGFPVPMGRLKTDLTGHNTSRTVPNPELRGNQAQIRCTGKEIMPLQHDLRHKQKLW
jgi:hypothetical protein